MTVVEHRWTATAAPLATRYDDMCFLDRDVGWVVNSHGQILATTDGGQTWREQARFPDVYLRTIAMSDERVGWVGSTTPDARLFHTRDGGASWRRVNNLPGATPAAICGLCTVGPDHVFAAGTNYPDAPTGFLKSSDGGQTWSLRPMDDVATLLVDVYFKDEREGWVVGGRSPRANPGRADVSPVVLHTTDGGQTWRDVLPASQLDLPTGEWGWKIQFVDDEFAIIACENYEVGALLVTEDKGATWRRQEIRDAAGRLINANLEGVGFLDRQTGWVGGWGDRLFESGRTSETRDGGATWTDVTDTWPRPLLGRPCRVNASERTGARGQYLNRFCFPDVRASGEEPVVYAAGNTIYKRSAEPAQSTAPDRRLESAPVLIRALAMSDQRAEIHISVPDRTRQLSVRIYDRFAELVRVLVDEATPRSGERTLHWDLRDERGRPVKPGQLVVRMGADAALDSRLLTPARHVSGAGNTVLPHFLRRS